MQLKGFEFVKAVHLDPIPFDMERNLLTPTFKKKRDQFLKYYQVCSSTSLKLETWSVSSDIRGKINSYSFSYIDCAIRASTVISAWGEVFAG